jgi:hypothetical protein
MRGVVTNPRGSCSVTVSTSVSASRRSVVGGEQLIEVKTSVGISWLYVLILVAVLPAHINTITSPAYRAAIHWSLTAR